MPDIPLTFASAFLVGLLHSLEPSHAKAVLASYFLNQKRTILEAVTFALVVTFAHTFTIYAMAIVGYSIGPRFQKETIEHWSGLIGGLVLLTIGAWMFWSEWRAGFHKDECCAHDHEHGHFFHHHSYHHDHPTPSSLRQIFVLGFCSGAIPCMSGLGILVLAWTTASPLKGLSLVAAFSAGLGVVVLVMCLAMQQMAHLMDRYWKNSSKWTRLLPVLSSIIILLMGIYVLTDWYQN